MATGRLEAFSDGVIAIIITIMVLELQAPHGTTWSALVPLVPVFLTYLLSFIFLGIYWNNHHHMLQATESINGSTLWANLHLLFWLSLVPFVTGWMGDSHFAAVPTAAYGVVLFLAALAYSILQSSIVHHQGEGSKLRKVLGRDIKGKLSLIFYLVAIPAAFISEMISILLYIIVAAMWVVPDRRIERGLRMF